MLLEVIRVQNYNFNTIQLVMGLGQIFFDPSQANFL